MLITLSFLIGCLSTYLITILSSTVISSIIIEEAVLSFAITLMVAHETNRDQVEIIVVNAKLGEHEERQLKKKTEEAFEAYANSKIDAMYRLVPPAHHNAVGYRNFKELKAYLEKKRKGGINA